jgi:hypothetical protein
MNALALFSLHLKADKSYSPDCFGYQLKGCPQIA